LRGTFERQRGKTRVIAPDRDQSADAELRETFQGLGKMRGILGGVGSRRFEDRSASKMNPADLFNGQWRDPTHVALHDPLEALLDTQDLSTLRKTADRCGADYPIDTWRRTSADEYGNCFSHRDCSFIEA